MSCAEPGNPAPWLATMPNEPIEWAVLTLFGLLIYIAHVFERRLNKIEYRVSQLDGEPLDTYIRSRRGRSFRPGRPRSARTAVRMATGPVGHY